MRVFRWLFLIYSSRRYKRIHRPVFLPPSSSKHTLTWSDILLLPLSYLPFNFPLHWSPHFFLFILFPPAKIQLADKKSHFSDKQRLDKDTTAQINKPTPFPLRSRLRRNEASANDQIRTNPKIPNWKAALRHLWSHQCRQRWLKDAKPITAE